MFRDFANVPYRFTPAFRKAAIAAAFQRSRITHRVATLTEGRAPAVSIRRRASER